MFYKNHLHTFGVFRFHGGSAYSERQPALRGPESFAPFHRGAGETVALFQGGFRELDGNALHPIRLSLDSPLTWSSFEFRRFYLKCRLFRCTFGSTLVYSLSLSLCSLHAKLQPWCQESTETTWD